MNQILSSERSLLVSPKTGNRTKSKKSGVKAFSFRKGVVLEIVLLRRKADMMGKTFSSSFVRDCRSFAFYFIHK